MKTKSIFGAILPIVVCACSSAANIVTPSDGSTQSTPDANSCFNDAGRPRTLHASDNTVAGLGLTLGLQSEVAFGFESGDLLPNPARPMLRGTREVIFAVASGIVTDVHAYSIDTTVATVGYATVTPSCCHLSPENNEICDDGAAVHGVCPVCDDSSLTLVTIPVRALNVGVAQLELTTARGESLDSIDVSIVDFTSFQFYQRVPNSDWTPVSSISAVFQSPIRVRAVALDSTGQPLEARYGIRASCQDATRCQVREPGAGASFADSADSFDVEVQTLRTGDTMLNFVTSSGQGSLPIHIE